MHVMQNFGVLCVFGFEFLGTLLFFTQYDKRTARETSVTLYKEGSDRVPVYEVADEEKGVPGDRDEKREEPGTADDSDERVPKSEAPGQRDIFSWKNIQYEVPVAGGHIRKLLDDVSGYVAPGKLTALMGETGAGKVAIFQGTRCVAADRVHYVDRRCY